MTMYCGCGRVLGLNIVADIASRQSASWSTADSESMGAVAWVGGAAASVCDREVAGCRHTDHSS